MIKSFKHKGLEKFYLTGSKAGIQPAHAVRLREQLTALNLATTAADLDRPAWKLHALHGELRGSWAISVNANWRLTFQVNGRNVEILDYQDYH
jgi:proteic killer suppression protein